MIALYPKYHNQIQNSSQSSSETKTTPQVVKAISDNTNQITTITPRANGKGETVRTGGAI
jgi:hypothetical protein